MYSADWTSPGGKTALTVHSAAASSSRKRASYVTTGTRAGCRCFARTWYSSCIHVVLIVVLHAAGCGFLHSRRPDRRKTGYTEATAVDFLMVDARVRSGAKDHALVPQAASFAEVGKPNPLDYAAKACRTGCPGCVSSYPRAWYRSVS